jgi:hypothetical protein
VTRETQNSLKSKSYQKETQENILQLVISLERHTM